MPGRCHVQDPAKERSPFSIFTRRILRGGTLVAIDSPVSQTPWQRREVLVNALSSLIFPDRLGSCPEFPISPDPTLLSYR